MKKRIEKKDAETPAQIQIASVFEVCHQWCFALAYKGKLYTLLDDGRIVKKDGQL